MARHDIDEQARRRPMPITSGELDTEGKNRQFVDAYAEDLLVKFPDLVSLQTLERMLVAGAGFEPAAFRL